MDTRRVFQLGIGVLALILLVALAAIFLSEGGGSEYGTRLLSLEDLEEQQVVEFPEHEVFVVWNDGDPLVLSSDAQHVGDDVVWCESSGMFESPAHGEKFDSRGFYYGGPAKHGLPRFPYGVIDEVIYVQDVDEPPTEGPSRGRGPPHEPRGPFCVPA